MQLMPDSLSEKESLLPDSENELSSSVAPVPIMNSSQPPHASASQLDSVRAHSSPVSALESSVADAGDPADQPPTASVQFAEDPAGD